MSDKGWICPKCQCVYAPYVPNCFKCNEKPSFNARLEERAKIVAWLRSPDQSDDDKQTLYWANEIEAGEYLK